MVTHLTSEASTVADAADVMMDEIRGILDPPTGTKTSTNRVDVLSQYLVENGPRMRWEHYMLLAQHQDTTPRLIVARYDDVPEEVLTYIVDNDRNETVLTRAANRGTISSDSLRVLMRLGARLSDYRTTCWAAARNPNLSGPRIREFVEFHLTFDMNPAFPDVYHNSKISEYNIFSNPSLPVDLIEKTIESEFSPFYAPLVTNPALSVEQLKQIAAVNLRTRMSATDLTRVVRRLSSTSEFEEWPYEWVEAEFGLQAGGHRYA